MIYINIHIHIYHCHYRCVGGCVNSWSYNGQSQGKGHNNKWTGWGSKFSPEGDRVLGVAADMCEGRLLFGLDGVWTHPMGEAFIDLDTNVSIFPAITAENVSLVVNFGQVPFKFGPPDSTFKRLLDLQKS